MLEACSIVGYAGTVGVSVGCGEVGVKVVGAGVVTVSSVGESVLTVGTGKVGLEVTGLVVLTVGAIVMLGRDGAVVATIGAFIGGEGLPLVGVAVWEARDGYSVGAAVGLRGTLKSL